MITLNLHASVYIIKTVESIMKIYFLREVRQVSYHWILAVLEHERKRPEKGRATSLQRTIRQQNTAAPCLGLVWVASSGRRTSMSRLSVLRAQLHAYSVSSPKKSGRTYWNVGPGGIFLNFQLTGTSRLRSTKLRQFKVGREF